MNPDPKPSPEELARRWRKITEEIDKELREKGVTDEQREQLIREILEEDDEEG